MTPAIPRTTALRQSRFVQSGCMGYLHWVRSWLYFDVKFVLSFAAFSLVLAILRALSLKRFPEMTEKTFSKTYFLGT
jgi:hypothetical protein